MPQLNTLSQNEKLDLVLKTTIAYGNGKIADKTIANIYFTDAKNVQRITDILQSDGLVELNHFDSPDHWQQITVTTEGRLFAIQGGYAKKVEYYSLPGLQEFDNKFHEFSFRVHRIGNFLFWTASGVLIACLIYLLWEI